MSMNGIQILELFKQYYLEDKKMDELQLALKNAPTWQNAQAYAERLGELVGMVYADTNILDGDLSQEVIFNLIQPTLNQAYDLCAQASGYVQKFTNEQYGFNLKALIPTPDGSRIQNLATELANKGYVEIYKSFNAQVQNITQAAVDDTMKKNATFLSNSGIKTEYRRIPDAGACKWCRSMAGTYTAVDAPDGFWGHHTNCHCQIEIVVMKKADNYWRDRWTAKEARERMDKMQ